MVLAVAAVDLKDTTFVVANVARHCVAFDQCALIDGMLNIRNRSISIYPNRAASMMDRPSQSLRSTSGLAGKHPTSLTSIGSSGPSLGQLEQGIALVVNCALFHTFVEFLLSVMKVFEDNLKNINHLL